MFWFTGSPGAGGSATIQTQLANLGYNSHRYQNCNANGVRIDMGTDKVFAIIAHGLPGRVQCYNSTTMSGNAVSSDSYNYSLAAAYSGSAFSSMNFAYYGACYSGATDATYGNLPSKTVSLGSKCAIGFTSIVDNTCTSVYEGTLFIDLRYGYTISAAIADALQVTWNACGTYGGTNNYSIYGVNTTKIN